MKLQRLVPVLLVGLTATFLASFGAAGEPSANRRTPMVRAIARIRPSVVNIHSQKNSPPGSRFPVVGRANGQMSGMGTGVVIDERGYIVTNYHVIEDVSSIRVTLVDGASFPAEVVARDVETDIAMLKINPISPLMVMPIGTSSDLLLGESVVAIGNAFGYQDSITRGIISALHRDVRLSDQQTYRDLIQTDASINPGNSGGPLINIDGEMIGLNVAIRAGAQGIGFAIPADDLVKVIAKLLAGQREKQTWHGMVLRTDNDASREAGRIVVEKVEPSSPADIAGISAGDRVIAVDRTPVNLVHDIERGMLDVRAGRDLPVTIARSGEQRVLSMNLQPLPEEKSDMREFVWRRFGLKLDTVDDANEVKQASTLLRGGLRIKEIATGGTASKAGLRRGDLLVGLHDRETLSVDHVVYILNLRDEDETLNPLRFFVIRDGQIHRGWIEIPREETSIGARMLSNRN